MRRTKLAAVGALVLDTVIKKNASYGDSATKSGDILRLLCPDGIKPEQYNDLQLIVRILDKVCRIMSGTIDNQALLDAYADIAGYGVLGRAGRKEKE